MDDLIHLTSDLIRFRSTAGRPEMIAQCADFVTARLDQHDIAYRRSENQGLPSIWVLPQPDYAPVLLMSHLDVVEGPPELFEPRLQGDCLWGRGSIDDKYAVALSLLLLEDFIERSGGELSRLPFGILITADEEVGGRNGAQAALAQIRADFAIALDGGNLKKIVIREKGILQLKLVCRGVAAHGARPWLGENAIEKLMADYGNIRRLFHSPAPDHWHRTLNWGRVQGGEAVNQVPDRAEAVLDIRYTEADDPELLLAEIRRAVAGEVEVLAQEPLFEGGESPYLERLRALTPDTEIGFEHGASDARFLSRRNIPGIVWGADGDMSQHSAEEHLNLPSAGRLRQILTRFFETLPTKE